jgi:hypothetical protein
MSVLERLSAAGLGLVATTTGKDRQVPGVGYGHSDWGEGMERMKRVGRGRKRSVSAMTETEEEQESHELRQQEEEDVRRLKQGLPMWDVPRKSTGRGGRKAMPNEEMLARRRARNKVAGE